MKETAPNMLPEQQGATTCTDCAAAEVGSAGAARRSILDEIVRTPEHDAPGEVPATPSGATAAKQPSDRLGRAAGSPSGRGLVGECVADRHTTLVGRAQIRWLGQDGNAQERWLPCLMNVAVRMGDRVLLLEAANWPEPIVVGVVDGFAARSESPSRGPTVELKSDESLCVVSEAGQPLVEVSRGDKGALVRLLGEDVDLEVSGDLRLSAKAIELRARQGDVRVEATDDVVVKGETIELN
jgi:hypothetical protein